MNFVSNVLDAIPVVGHVKGIIHYAVGDEKGGDKAMYQSTRTSALIGGGVIGGIVGGPAGAIGAAMYTGVLADTVASAAMDKPQGLVRHCENVYNDVKQGRNPSQSLLFTGLHLGFDALGGSGLGGLSNAAASSVGNTIAANLGEQVIQKSVKATAEELAKITAQKAAEVVVQKTVEKTVEQTALQVVSVGARAALETVTDLNAEADANQTIRERNTNARGNNKGKTGNENNGKNTGSKKSNDLSEFFKLLKEVIETICRRVKQTKFLREFQNLSPGQKKSLVNIIKKLNCSGILETVLKVAIQIFDQYFPSDFTFVNFLSLMEFVKSYINDEIEKRVISRTTASTVSFQQPLLTSVITTITDDLDLVRKIAQTFNDIRAEIEIENAREPVIPNFNDTFSAVSHYFKHKTVPDGGVLSVDQYYNWIRCLLGKIRLLPEFYQQNPGSKIVYELYVAKYGRRIKIVLKFQGGKIALSSCYVVSTVFFDDKDRDIFINGIRRPAN